MAREYAVTPDDLMDLDRALAIVVTHDKAGAPWLIGPESAVLDRAKRTVRYYAERTFQKEMRSESAPESGETMTDPFQHQRS
jgi:hypothetical protein